MLKSRLQEVTNIFSENTKLQSLFAEFNVDFDSVSKTLIKDVLLIYDELIQENTVYTLAENPDKIIGQAEVTEITCVADVANSLGGKYFIISAPTSKYYVWFDTGASADPNPGGMASIQVAININDTAVAVALATKNTLDAEVNFSAAVGTNVSVDDHIVTVTNTSDGDVDDANNGPGYFSPGFSFNITTQGRDPIQSISSLNESVSIALGLYPGQIASPHEDNYRTFYSPKSTVYTYFLKWIYYCYKYFNEEQFFFHNLLDRFVPEYDREIISSTTNLKIYFDGLGILLDTIDQKIENLYNLSNVDTIEEQNLQYLAQLLGYQKEDFSIQSISFRELIKNLIEIYKTKGTVYSFELFFKLLGFDAELREYYWDRDAMNPEGFASVTSVDYLYYLTIQDPRMRTKIQREDMSLSVPIQPIDTVDWVKPKDLRDFNDLQSSYSLDEILGFKSSSLESEKRFTYFKTNFINFRLTQFYTKQDLTAKDTDTILKYVRFLTPIYVSAFVEVITTPWEDVFEMENTEAASVNLEGYPGVPPWVDILLPFLFVTLRDYIPLNLMPAPLEALVIANTAITDNNLNGYSDSALSSVFGNPAHGITLAGTVQILTTVDLSLYNNFVTLKVDKGRGVKISIVGNLIQTYAQLITELQFALTAASIDTTVMSVGITPNIDIRVYSNETGPDSKVYFVDGDTDDLFTGLSCTLLTPVDGHSINKGYQDFGLSIINLTDPTGLSTTVTYNFYINIDVVKYSEIDVSGTSPASTTLSEIVKSINNHYDINVKSNFISATNIEYIGTDILTSGKVAVVFRDITMNSGKLVLVNTDGSLYKSGINFSLFDVRNATIASSGDEMLKRFFVAYYDTLNNQAKWTVYTNEGNKILTDQIFEPPSSQVKEIKAITLSNNKVALIYTMDSPVQGKLKIIDLTGPTVIATETWYTGSISEIDAVTNGTGLVVGGNTTGGGLIIYLKNDGTFAINGDQGDSTKTFIASQVEDICLAETTANEIFISYQGSVDNKGYLTIWDAVGNQIAIPAVFSNDTIERLAITNTSNNKLLLAYDKQSDSKCYTQVYQEDGALERKELLLYDDDTFTELNINKLAAGHLIITMVCPNKGLLLRLDYLGQVANTTFDNKLKLDSVFSGDTWDDNVENYAQTTDEGHKFMMNNSQYVFDNYSTYYRGLGVDFTQERNRFNTFYSSSPNDDLIDLIQDSLTMAFTLLIGVNEFPADKVDAVGFYMSRNGYISRNPDYTVLGNREKGYYTRHLKLSETLRTDPVRVNKEINWPEWNKENTTYDDWSSWALAIDYLQPSIIYPGYVASGGITISGSAIHGVYTVIGSGGITVSGAGGYQEVGL